MRAIAAKRAVPAEIIPAGRPEPSSVLTKAQLELWREIVSSLPEDLLSRADNQVLERMAIAWATFRETAAVINQTGLLVKGVHGEMVRNPMLSVQRQATQEMQECGNSLGLSPQARTRISAPKQVDKDPLTVLLGPHGKSWGDERAPKNAAVSRVS